MVLTLEAIKNSHELKSSTQEQQAKEIHIVTTLDSYRLHEENSW